jgi:hypothetical protein
MPMEVNDCLQVDTDPRTSDLTPVVEQEPNQDCDSHHDSIELGEQGNGSGLYEAEEPSTSDQAGHGRAQDNEKDHRWKPPSVEAAKVAHMKIKNILHLKRQMGHGYKDPKLDLLLKSQLEAMQHFLWTFTNPESHLYNKWMAASLDTGI